MFRSLIAVATIAGAVLVAGRDAAAMTSFSEVLGNKPVEEDLDWPIGVFGLVNLECRVLHRTASSGMVEAKDDEFFYRGSTHELNDALLLFTEVESDHLEVILLPGAPEEELWREGDPVPYDWKVHVPGTYRRQEAQREKGTEVRTGWPTMAIHTGGWVDLDEIEVPAGVAVLGPADLMARYVKGLASDERNIRWQAATHLQRLAPYADAALPPLLTALEDDDLYVRCAAADSLSRFGRKAAAALPKLRAMLEDADLDPGPRKTLAEAARRIEEAEDKPAEDERLRAQVTCIEEFCRAPAARERGPVEQADG